MPRRVALGPPAEHGGLWRQLVRVDGEPAVAIVDPPIVKVLTSSATWARSGAELAAMADLERKR